MLLMLMLALMSTAKETLLLAGKPYSDTTMQDDEPGRGPVQLTRERATPLPLPLPLAYQSNGKHTESVESGAEKVEDGHGRQPSELRTMRKALAVIGDPLPLDYLGGGVEEQKEEQDKEEQRAEEEAVQRPAAQGRKHRALRLADLGQPLPLKYNPAFNESWRTEQRLKTQTQVQGQTQTQTQTHQQSTRQAPAASVYDFGTPLPLPYADADNDAIETEEYLRWKGSAAPGSFEEWKTEQEGRSRIPSGHSVRKEGDTSQLQRVENVTSSTPKARDARIQDTDPGEASTRDASSETPPAEEEEQEPMPEIKPEPEPEPETEPQMAVDHEIQRYILHEDYRGLEERLDDAEFRLRLLRYTRRLKRQYDALCKALHEPAIDDDTTGTSTGSSPGLLSAPRRAVVLQSAALSTGAFVLLCTISYFLAD